APLSSMRTVGMPKDLNARIITANGCSTRPPSVILSGGVALFGCRSLESHPFARTSLVVTGAVSVRYRPSAPLTMQLLGVREHCCAGVALLFGCVAAVWGQEAASALSADQALSILLAGNARFVAYKERHPDESADRRRELVSGQHPFA